MKVLVLLAGAADPKWPVRAAQLLPGAAPVPRKLSPFDESALECALKLRDAQADVAIHALLVGVRPEEALARGIAAFRLDGVENLVVDAALAWDAAALAAELAAVVRTLQPDVVLMGREFGDTDDGMLAPLLAEALGRPCVMLAQSIRAAAGGFELARDRGELVEHVILTAPLLASITNDKANRLRFALMKNIALARQQAIPVRQAQAAGTPLTVRVQLGDARDAAEDAAGTGCRMLGGSLQEQAAALAALLQGRAA